MLKRLYSPMCGISHAIGESIMSYRITFVVETRQQSTVKSLGEIKRRAVSTQAAAFASGTKSNIQSHVNSYLAFCIYFSLVPFPLTCSNIIPFLQLFSESVSSYGYINNVLSSIKSMSNLLGHFVDKVTSVHLTLFLSGLKRSMGLKVTQMLPVTPHMLKMISSIVDFKDSFQVCVWSAILFMFFSFFRKSNVLPDSVRTFDPSKQVTRSSIVCHSMMMLVKVTWSKTIQFKQRVLYIPIASVPGSKLCPVYSYKLLTTLVHCPPEAPAFSYCIKGQTKVLVYSTFVKQFRYWLQCINVKDSHSYCSHSLRRGGATWAFQCGVTPDLIKFQGDWQSDCYRKYIQLDLSQKLSTTSAMARQLLKYY